MASIAKNSINPIILLKIAVFCLFMGRGWQHLFFDVPFRALFWDPHFFRGIVENFFGMSWDEYLKDLRVDKAIETSKVIISGFLFLCALFTVIVGKGKRLIQFVIYLGSIYLVLFSLFYFKDHFYRIGQFIEYTTQFATPVLLIMVINQRSISTKFLTLAKVALALTFTGHGLYAIGYYPVPGKFVQMVITAIPVNDGQAMRILLFAGVLDIIAALAIFVRPIQKPALIYMMIWGFLTAAARLYSTYYPDDFGGYLQRWVHEFAYRVPHFILPALLLLYETNRLKLIWKEN